MMFVLDVPRSYEEERRYIARVLVEEFLGFPVETVAGERTDVRLALRGDASGGEVILPDGLFASAPGDWLTPRANPASPTPLIEPGGFGDPAPAIDPRLPVLYGHDARCAPAEWRADRTLFLNAFLFGAAFWFLTRYEEYVTLLEDAMGQVAARATVAARRDWVRRPLVNEYVEILAWAIARVWPGLRRASRKPRFLISHDVDYPWATSNTATRNVFRGMASDLVRGLAPDAALRRLYAWLHPEPRRRDVDPFNTFDLLMNLSEAAGLRSAFYFMAGAGHPMDGNYHLSDPWIRALMRQIHARGHEIGLHPGFESYLDPEQTKREFDALLLACHEEGIEQDQWGGRQHWLRWRNPTTWQNWEDAGLAYDSSLAFFDQVGFRCGVCCEYPVFNLATRRPLRLRERPLAVMDCTPGIFMKRRWGEIVPLVEEILKTCRRYGGDFTLLWHNSFLVSSKQRACYANIMKHAAPARREAA